MSEHDVAVIGMAGRFPGASSIEEYWANLSAGISSIRDLTEQELLAAGVTAAELADPAYVRKSPVLDDMDQFDATFFRVSPRDASVMDPAHRMFLEVAWEAMEHAGHTGLPSEGTVGVFATSGAPYYLMDNVRRNPELMEAMGEFLVRHTNNDMNFLATRVSYEMDLRGPSINVQTACSSALVAVHMACASIRRGECSMALAGGSTVNVPHGHGYLYREGEILSPDGVCRPFDAASAGTVFGSGTGCVVLKRLDTALDDGDTIHAVIKGSAVNNDGAMRVGYLAPGVEGQSAAVERALEVAAVSADSVSYIETHGTGTTIGDPIEVAALTQAFRRHTAALQFCAIGSVKSNIGHLGEAAGVAALIKVILALKHRQLPPSLGYESPNPQIAFEESPFFVNDRLRPWHAGGRLRCGITALGAGGTNCHMILEEAPAAITGEGARDAQLIVLSAKSAASLSAAQENLSRALEEDATVDLADAAYTLAVGRRPMPHRRALVARTAADAIAQLRTESRNDVVRRADDHAPTVAFMFPGGGAQYARMGIGLFEAEPVYREAVEECLAIVNTRLGRDLGALMFARKDEVAAASRALESPSLSLPATFTTEYALARLLESWGIEPAAFVGHSMGEYVAACLADVMTLEEGLELVMLRGRLFESLPRGRMLSVPLAEEELRALMPKGLDIAAVNAAELCVASGPEALIEQLEGVLAARGLESTRVRIDVAAHSAMLDPILDRFEEFCRTIKWRAPRGPLLSNVTGKWMTSAEATDPRYWVRHLRSTVRFADCLETLRSSREHVLLEIGPGRTLASLARAQHAPARYAFNTMRHPDEDAKDLDYALLALGRLWSVGVTVDWSAMYDGQLRNRIPLPTYAWDHRRHWVDAPAVSTAPADGPVQASGRRANVADWFARPAWRQTMSPAPLTRADERVLLFCDETGFGDAVAARLAAAGRRVTLVRAGTEWTASENEIVMRPAEPADHARLLDTMLASGGLPERVVHCWGVTPASAPPSLDDIKERGFHSLLCFAQAVSSEHFDARMTLDVVTSGLQRIGGEPALEPAKALALGPVRSMPSELPNVRTRAIDVIFPAPGRSRDVLAALVAAEIGVDPLEETVAFRGRDRFVQSLEPVRLAHVAQRLRERGVYVITGGLGGIGYELAKHLAKVYRARLVLIGRSAATPRSRAKVTDLLALGADVEVVQADVTSVEQVRHVFAQARNRFGDVHGVFHAAGVLGDSLMVAKSREDADRVLAPKVLGTLALDAAIGDAPLDLFVLFSSVSSIAGLPGQADYTAANAFLDAFAAERSLRSDGQTVSVNWSAWRDVGMVANLTGSGDASEGDVHPVLGRHLRGDANLQLFASTLSVDSQWVLREHRLRGGRAIMPGTGLLEIAAAAFATRGESRTLELRDMAFISALVVEDEGEKEMRVAVQRTGDGVDRFTIVSAAESPDGGVVWQEHVTGRGGHVDVPQPAPIDLAGIAARCTAYVSAPGMQEESAHMDFGGRWKNVRSVRRGEGEALLALELPEAFVADLVGYRLHPALLDIATGSSAALVPGYDPARDFYVPLSYTQLRSFAPLPQRIHSHVRLIPGALESDDIAVFDVTVTDDAGRVLIEVEEFMMSRVTDVSRLQAGARSGPFRPYAAFEPPAASGALVWRSDDAIRPAEGIAALEVILSALLLPQVFATPQPWESLLADLRRPPEREQVPAAAPAPALERLPEIEASLTSHDSVASAVVVERGDRTGRKHLVAYVLLQDGEYATASELRRYLKKQLPPASVPGNITILDAMPVDAGGAIDLSALHDPFALADDHVPPRTETERVIAAIWKETLGVERIGVRDNFFDIGGHSLLAVRASMQLNRAVGVRLNQVTMAMQTLEQVAAEVDRQLTARREVGTSPSPAAAQPGAVPVPAEKAAGGLLRSLRRVVAGGKE